MKFYLFLLNSFENGSMTAEILLDRAEERQEVFSSRGWNTKRDEYILEYILLKLAFEEISPLEAKLRIVEIFN